jgi:hypothetical protein
MKMVAIEAWLAWSSSGDAGGDAVDRLRARGEAGHAISLLLEKVRHHRCNDRLVIDDKHFGPLSHLELPAQQFSLHWARIGAKSVRLI